ncbi:MAG: LPS export ABC transporter periplasmic protein LptC [Saprospiraceae bacterium]|nr:LPS export ABC transporter periplasmic protein LptC [Saprospiraceae bacterium]
MKRLSFFLLLSIGLYACKVTSEDRAKADVQNQQMPDQTADSVHIIHSEEGIIKLQIRAPKLVSRDTREEQFQEFPDGVIIEFYNKDGDKTADLFGDYGKDSPGLKKRVVQGNVVIINDKNDTIRTDELIMLDKQGPTYRDTIHNDGKYVSIKRQDGTFIQGYGLVADNNFQNVVVNNVFESTVSFEEEDVSSNTGTGATRPQQQRPQLQQR